MTTSGADTPRAVTQVREQLHETFDGVIDDSDIAHFRGGNYEQRFLSRALAALAVRRVGKCSVAEAARFVTDGIADQGLDAIAPSPRAGRFCLSRRSGATRARRPLTLTRQRRWWTV